jgi:hypothetical protein
MSAYPYRVDVSSASGDSKQIPCGDDKQKTGNNNDKSRSLRDDKPELQLQLQLQLQQQIPFGDDKPELQLQLQQQLQLQIPFGDDKQKNNDNAKTRMAADEAFASFAAILVSRVREGVRVRF